MTIIMRFSKVITVLCIIMNVAITVFFILMLWRGIVLDGAVVCAIYAPFAIELGFNALIACTKEKHNKENEDGNDS